MTEGDFPKRLGIPLQVEQIEADREDPQIKKRFEKELKKAATASLSAAHHHDDEHDHVAHDHDDHGGILFTRQDWKRRLVLTISHERGFLINETKTTKPLVWI